MPRFAHTIVFIVVAAVHALSPVGASYDSRWTVPVVVSLLERGDTDIDEYAALVEPDNQYSVVKAGGHLYNWYPIGGPLLAAPVVVAIQGAAAVGRPVLERTGRESFQALARGDLVAARGVVEVLAASVFVAATAALLFAIARRYLPLWSSLLVVAAFAFGSSAWSTGSRAFWQHTPSMLLLTITLWIAIRAINHPRVIQFAAIPLAISFCVRPTNAVAILVFTMFVAVEYREFLLRYVLCATPFAIALAAYHLSVFGQILPSYYLLTPKAGQASSWLVAFVGLLASPSRGLLLYTPWIVVAVLGAALAWKSNWLGRLPRWIAVILVLHTLMLSSFTAYWYGGHSYGPRLFTELIPFFAFLLIPLFLVRRSTLRTAALCSALLFSVLVHGHGALDPDGYRWNVDPVNVDIAPERLWDWSDPQFLRGL